jgi:hypothetical protein
MQFNVLDFVKFFIILIVLVGIFKSENMPRYLFLHLFSDYMDHKSQTCGKQNCPAGKQIAASNAYKASITNANRVGSLVDSFTMFGRITHSVSGRYLYYTRRGLNALTTSASEEAIFKSKAMIKHMEKGDNIMRGCRFYDCVGSEITYNRMVSKANIADDKLLEVNNKIIHNNNTRAIPLRESPPRSPSASSSSDSSS